MSISTKTGDDGSTGLMYNRRVSKCDPRIEACGAVDELNAALGMVRATASEAMIQEHILMTQKELVLLMGEIATLPKDLERYRKDGFKMLQPAMTRRLDELVKWVESQSVSFKGWATPGTCLPSAALEVARTACRRSERRIQALRETGTTVNSEILVYLNRLSDCLWLLARWTETRMGCS